MSDDAVSLVSSCANDLLAKAIQLRPLVTTVDGKSNTLDAEQVVLKNLKERCDRRAGYLNELSKAIIETERNSTLRPIDTSSLKTVAHELALNLQNLTGWVNCICPGIESLNARVKEQNQQLLKAIRNFIDKNRKYLPEIPKEFQLAA